jgi:radical SAM protein with 4Fe4S-binding SPASM domain
MKYYLTQNAVLKWLEHPSVYHIKKDDLYELDDLSLEFLRKCASHAGCGSEDAVFIDYCLVEDILQKNQLQLKRPPLIKSPEPSLRYLELQITDRCNLKCKHCYIGDKRRSELSVIQIQQILKEFEEMQGLRVLISGGEPLLHRGFQEINSMLPGFFLRKVLFTNGLLLDRERLRGLNVDEIQISVDGLENAHDSLRGKGTFTAAVNALRHAIDSGFEVSVSTMIHPGNLQDFDVMERLFREIGIKDWTVDVPCTTGRLADNNEFQISPAIGGKYLKYGYGEGLHSGASGFACGLHLMAVMADGQISKCTFYAESLVGRIEDGLQACWLKIKPVRLDELKCDCSYKESCRGGCRYRAFLLGDPLGKDLYKCASYDIMEK